MTTSPTPPTPKPTLGRLLLLQRRLWEFLQPVFTSEDLVEQLPEQARKFSKVDETWRGVMLEVAKAPNALGVFVPGGAGSAND